MFLGCRPADGDIRASGGLHRVAEWVDHVEGAGRVGVGGERHRQLRAWRSLLGARRDLCDAGDARRGFGDGRDARVVGDDDDGGRVGSGGEGLRDQSLSAHGLWLSAERVRGGEVGGERRQSGREHEQDGEAADPGRSGASGDAITKPPPAAMRRVCPGVTGVWHERPEGAPPADQKQRRQQRQRRDHGQSHPDCRERSQPGRGVDLCERDDQQCCDDGSGGGDDRGRCAGERQAHGLVGALRAAQLLAVAGDQEQGVVGARAEHQDQRDAGGLPVDGHADRRQRVAGRPQQLLGGHHREDRDDPEHRAAIDQHQQHQHQQ